MNKRSLTLISAAALVIIIILSVFIGFAYDAICTKIEIKKHPLEFTDLVEQNALQYDIPQEIIYSVIMTESAFNHKAVSKSGAMGLMQIMPETFKWLQSRTGDEYSDEMLFVPEVNLRYGCLLLSILYEKLGIWDNVYAAYNAGIGRVNEWLKDTRYSTNGLLTDIPIEETRNYVKKVNENIEAYRRLYFSGSN